MFCLKLSMDSFGCWILLSGCHRICILITMLSVAAAGAPVDCGKYLSSVAH